MKPSYQQASQAFWDGRYEEAERLFDELLKSDRGNPKLMIGLGETYLQLGKIEFARAQFQQVLTLDTRRIDPQMRKHAESYLTKIESQTGSSVTRPAVRPDRDTTIAVSNGNIPAPTQTAIPIPAKAEPTPKNPPPVAPQPVNPLPIPAIADAVPPIATPAIATPAIATPVTAAPAQAMPPVQAPAAERAVSEPAVAKTPSKPSGQTAPPAPTPAPVSTKPAPGKSRPTPTTPTKLGAKSSRSLRQKVTGLAIAISIVPVALIGALAYQLSSTAIVEKTQKEQEFRAASAIQNVNRFMAQQYEGSRMLGSLFSPVVFSPNPKVAVLQKQALLYRLNLYKQAYKNYDSIAIFDLAGNQIAQSAGTANPNTLDANLRQQVLAGTIPLISKPFLVEQEHVVNFAVPLLDPATKKPTAILQARMPLNTIQQSLKPLGLENYAIVDAAGKYVLTSESGRTGMDATADYSVIRELQSVRQTMSTSAIVTGQGERLLSFAPSVAVEGLPELKWDALVSSDKNAALAAVQPLLYVVVIGTIVLLAIVVVLSRNLSDDIVYRIEVAIGALRRMAGGQYDKRVFATDASNDELTDLALGINAMADHFQMMLQKQQRDRDELQQQILRTFRALAKLAQVDPSNINVSDENIGLMLKRVQTRIKQKDEEVVRQRQEKDVLRRQMMAVLHEVKGAVTGDLTVVATSADGDVAEVAAFFNSVIEGLRQVVGQVKVAALQVNQSLDNNQQAIAELTDRAVKQADDINRSLNSVHMMTVSVTSIAESTRQAVDVAHQAAETAESGGKAMDRTMQTIQKLRETTVATAQRVKHLGESAQRVAKVVSLIDEIAVQTNFLAINASIEASRAGEGGRGFALVAEEVGELAARAAAATHEVEQLLGGIQSETSEVADAMEQGAQQVIESTELVEEAKKSLQQVTSVSQQIDELVQSISEATVSQARTSECVAGLMKDIAQLSGRTVGSSHDLTQSLLETSQQAETLQISLAKLKIEREPAGSP